MDNLTDQCIGCKNRNEKDSTSEMVVCRDMPKEVFIAFAQKKYVECHNKKLKE